MPIALHAEPKHFKIVLFSPNANDEDFWGNVHNFARASAKDLGVNFSIGYNTLGSRAHYLESVENILKSKNKPDAFMAVSFRHKTQKLLELSAKYDVPIILINNDLPSEKKDIIGPPRRNYKTYIGHISPDEEHMSYLLANHLLKNVKANNINDKDNPIDIVGIAGSRDAPESIYRQQGLERSVNEKGNARLMQVVYADWHESDAFTYSTKLIQRYDNLQLIWCSSDLMALGALRAIKESGKDIVTGGFDWTKNAIRSIKSDQLSASVGGHFTDAGYALVLLYDYLHGKDFSAVISSSIRTKGGLIHKGNVDKYYDFLIKQDWASVNFKKYSRIYHPENKSYDFSFDNLLDKNYTP